MEELKQFLQVLNQTRKGVKTRIIKTISFLRNIVIKGLMILKYDKLNPECDLSDEVTSYCRGLVIETSNFDMVCIPPEKAYKYSELVPLNIDYSELIFEEFYDGTMINVWYYNNEWNISTRSTIDANCKWYSEKNISTTVY